MPKEKSVSLREVAKRAGVSTMTASRALRGQPRVAESTKAKILTAATDLGYQPDPHLSRLMTRVRSRKQRSVQAVIAVLREDPPGEKSQTLPYRFVPLSEIRERALLYGFEVEEFWLGRDGLTPAKARRILRARGIEAVIVSPQSESLPCSQFDYSGFSAATFGFAMSSPVLHTAATNMNSGIQIAATELANRGYRRIGVALTDWIDRRVQNGYRSGLHLFQQNHPDKVAIPMLTLPEKGISRGFPRFREWTERHNPDAVISFDQYVPNWLTKLKLSIPEQIGYVVHDLTDDSGKFAGMNHRRNELAKAAVDLVVTQLQQFETGVPEIPRQILIPPAWVAGASVKTAP